VASVRQAASVAARRSRIEGRCWDIMTTLPQALRQRKTGSASLPDGDARFR
jgi:hypothetical protein